MTTLPATMQGGPAQEFKTLAPRASLSEGIGSGYGSIHYKGKTWSLNYRGKSYPFLRPDDGTQAAHIDVIILRNAPTKSKSYYPEGFTEGQSDGKAPICTSNDGITPDADAKQKQAEACVLCPHNQWEMKPNGKQGRDCADYKRLAVILAPYQTQKMLGTPLNEPVFLRVPAASLNDLATFGDTMQGQGWDFSAFVTRITFDPDKAHPKFVFTPLQAVDSATAQFIIPLISDPLSKRITGEIDFTRALPKPAMPATATVTPAQPAPMQTVIPPAVKPAAPAPMNFGSFTVQPDVVIPAQALSPPPAGQPPLQGAPSAPAPQTAEDTGATESSAELDARIAKLVASV